MVDLEYLEFTLESSDGTQVVTSIRRWDTGGLSRAAQE